MIIYPQSLVLSAAQAQKPLNYPRIAWDSYLKSLVASAISVSGETASGPKDAPLRPDTTEYWQAPSLPATWAADFGALRTIDYVGIAAHELGSTVSNVKVQFDTDSAMLDPNASLPGIAGNYASTPDSSATSIVGDIDLRVRVMPSTWVDAAEATFIAKYGAAGNRSYRLRTTGTGGLKLDWSNNGTTLLESASTVSAGYMGGTAHWVRATLDVNDGAGNHVVTFYTSEDGLTWTQLGASVTTVGVTSIFDSTAPLTVGIRGDGATQPMAGRFFYAEVRNGIGSAVVSVFDASSGADGGTSWAASTGEQWTLNISGVTPARLNNNILVYPVIPADDTPLLLLFQARAGRYLRITVTGSVAPKIASIYAGQVLVMENAICDPFIPINLAGETVRSTFLSRGGQFLGQSARRNGVASNVMFRYLTTAWVRQSFIPFARNIGVPYFLAWNPLLFPTDVGYVWHEQDIKPTFNGIRDLMDVGWPVVGIGRSA